jgi:hypothetical protein
MPAFAGMTLKMLHHGDVRQVQAGLSLVGNQDLSCLQCRKFVTYFLVRPRKVI